MRNNFFIILLIFSLCFSHPVLAQGDETDLGGKAVCFVRGNSPFKKFIADQNRILLFQGEDGAFGSIQLQSVLSNREEFLADVNILAIFEQIKNLNSFLNGKTQTFDNSDSELTLKKINKSDQVTTTVSDFFNDGSKSLINGRIKLLNRNNLANGSVRLGFLNSTIKVTSKTGETIESNENNGSIKINCKFKEIPIEIKDLKSSQ